MVVYTCITNQKDYLQPVSRQPGVRFVCFSDRKVQHPVWEWIETKDRGLNDPRRVARRYKILSHLYFPNQDTIWIDGRVRLQRPVAEYFDKYRGLICARPHHDRQCVYHEAEQIVKINYDNAGVINDQVERLKFLRYPKNNGLHETGMLLRRNDPFVVEFNERWWAWLSCYSKRDQMSFDVVAWQFDYQITNVDRNDVMVARHKRKTNVVL